MAFVWTTVAGTAVTVTAYSINPAKIYIISKQDHGQGSSSFNPEYLYFVDTWNKPAGEQTTVKSAYTNGDYMVILYGSEDNVSPYSILDYSAFVIASTGRACIQITIGHYGSGNNAVIWFSATDGSRTVTGDRAWGWGGFGTPTDAEYQAEMTPWILSQFGSTYTIADICGYVPPPPAPITISSLYAEYRGAGEIFIQWNQAGAGTVKVWINGMYDLFDGRDSTNTYTLTGMLPGTHTLCIEGDNKLCISVTISPPSPPPVACGGIPVDSWIVSTNNPLTGVNVPITIRSKDPNKHFLVQSNVLGGLNTLMFDGVTDSTGCFTGELIALPDGTYNVFVCYDILGICPFGANIGTKSITWGTKSPLSIDDLIKYAPYLIAAWAIATIAGAMRR